MRGHFDEYMYFGHRIFAFELEIGEDFQPAIADALVWVQESAAVMHALATETRTVCPCGPYLTALSSRLMTMR
jgi:hypothetical protein